MNLKGKRAFVTGGARRLGREIVLHLSQQGCVVMAHYHHSAAEAEALRKQTGCELFQADFASLSVQDFRQRLDKEAGTVDILINNASLFQKSDWTAIGEDLWDREIAVNLKIPFFLAQHFGPQMKKQGMGKIINMADIAAKRPYLQHLPYSVAKAGLVVLTQAMARALAPEVQVNAIAPGTVLFPEEFPEEARRKIIQKIPAGRTAGTDELLATVDFLLSDVDYITGQTIVLDGGRSLGW